MKTDFNALEPPTAPTAAGGTTGDRARRLFISTGEVSGDLQGGLLIEALHRQALRQQPIEVTALGGQRMAKAGANLLADTTAIGSIGLLESLPHVQTTLRIQRHAKQWLRQHPPDLVVLIDYFGPNLGIGRFIRQALPQVPIVYYIAPQEWVWSLSQRNTERILAISDRLLAIFPKEATYFQKHGGNVTWVGHPLLDRLPTAPDRAQARQQLGIAPEQLAIALIPASRQQELKYVLPPMLAAARLIQAQRPEVKFWLPIAQDGFKPTLDRAVAKAELPITLVPEAQASSQTVIAAADLALTKSGTVNLEIALLDVPQVVLYCLNPVTAWLAEHVLRVDVPFVSPVNLVTMEPIVPEFLQHHATPDRLAATALDLLTPAAQTQVRASYQTMRQALGTPGVCDRAAGEILAMLPVP